MGVLGKIVEYKMAEIEAQKTAVGLDELRGRAEGMPPCRDFPGALAHHPYPAIIAEIKKASPSKGVIREDFDPKAIALAYQQAGAAAISVLTDSSFFGGKLGHVMVAKAVTHLPVLRKDFIMDPYQVYQSRVGGADALLLITAILTQDTLEQLIGLTKSLGMEALVEVRNEDEVFQALLAGADVVGINNRDLDTLEVDLKVTEELSHLVPKNKIVVAESGIRTVDDIAMMQALGIDALLIGEAFMGSEDPGRRLAEFVKASHRVFI